MAHILHNFVGGAEAEGGWIADIELQDARALALHARRFVHNGAAYVVQNVVELGGFLELAHGRAPFGGGGGEWTVCWGFFSGAGFGGRVDCFCGLGGLG